MPDIIPKPAHLSPYPGPFGRATILYDRPLPSMEVGKLAVDWNSARDRDRTVSLKSQIGLRRLLLGGAATAFDDPTEMLPRSGLERSDFVLWHETDMPSPPTYVR
jgi:hypothetical protein